jgi:uncharacterized membrane protein YbhN (UPF0104 family)/tRNA A-37 threonylcarbamoyl transferase component Bud32
MCGHLIRAAKSKLLVDDIREAKVSTLFKGLSVGYLFNSLLPFRLGEFIRAFYVGDALSISKTAVFMSILIERMVDGIILSVFFITAAIGIRSTSESAYTLMSRFGIALLAVSFLLLAGIYIIQNGNRHMLSLVHRLSSLFNDRLADRLRFMAWSAVYGTQLMLANKQALAKYYLASIVMWMCYFASTACIAIAFFQLPAFSSLWYVIQSVYAAVSSPIGPGYVGTFSTIVTKFLSEIGLSSVTSFAVLMWVIIVTPISLVGLFVLIKQRLGDKKDIPRQEVLINKLYREKDISPELSHFLDAYFAGERINHLLTQAELAGRFRLIKSFKGGSNAHTMLVWQDGEMRVKKITLPQFADKLADQAKWLKTRQSLNHIPKVLTEARTKHYYSFDLKYYENYVPFFDFMHSHSSDRSIDVLARIIRFMDESIYTNKSAVYNTANVKSYIDNKILGKVNDTSTISGEISQLMTYKKIVVNSKSYDNILQIVDKIKNHSKIVDDLAHYDESVIHGDLTVDNVVVNESGDFLLLDPNNENQVSSAVVDYGKLYQSLHSGYEFMIQLDKCEIKGNAVNYEESMSQRYGEVFKELDNRLLSTLSPAAYRSILFHEAVHYCRMLTYRASINPNTVAVFYANAVKLFNEFLAQYEENNRSNSPPL